MCHQVRSGASQGSQFFNRQEALSRLQSLTPGSEEHDKLQSALMKTSGIAEVCLNNMSYKVNTSSIELPGGFGSSEHFAIGEQVKLWGLDGDNEILNVSGVPLLFQHIITLAGDFYALAGQAISLGGPVDEKPARFLRAFDTLVTANPQQLNKIIAEIDRERTTVRDTSLHNHCYSRHLVEGGADLHQIKPDLGDLLQDNSDHFSSCARDAYWVGHTLAMQMAADAGREQDLNKLKLAYAYDAFACHFLTDLFAAGHIRNQRGELELFL